MKQRKQILLFISCLIILSISCNLPAILWEQVRIFLAIPIMVEEDTIGVETNESTSEPVEENESEPASDISIEDCLAKPGEYTWEFANVNNEASNDTKKVCQGDFYLRNTSNRVLHFKWFEYWDNGAMQDIGWESGCQRLEPGEEFSKYFGTQTYSTENQTETVATFTKLIVFYNNLPDCYSFLYDKENETLWDEFSIPLSDPCR